MTADRVKQLASECGFELAGVTPALPVADADRYNHWISAGFAGEMRYLTDHRAAVRQDPLHLLPSAKSIICVGKLYNETNPKPADPYTGWISRYAWGKDYHEILRAGLVRLCGRLSEAAGDHESRICVDTAPLLERSYARLSGLGWIGKNTCLINQQQGSWFFLGELLTSLEITPDEPPPDRCGTCTRCIDACPTDAIVPLGSGFTLDARRCISYFTIELRSAIPEEMRPAMGNHLFGCDICQDVCPWNSKAPATEDPAFYPDQYAPDLMQLSELSESEFRDRFRESPIRRAKYGGFLRNVAIAMGNAGAERYREPLQRLSESTDQQVAEHARWALSRLRY
ncbi:MAG: tRNA epoxyqueuosine(34) reductase QueG [Bryobacteraceae bacterium]